MHEDAVTAAKLGPPGPLPTFIKFTDLRAAGIVKNHCSLRILIEQHGFPKGRWLGSKTHVWSTTEIQAWLDARPSEQPLPGKGVASSGNDGASQ